MQLCPVHAKEAAWRDGLWLQASRHQRWYPRRCQGLARGADACATATSLSCPQIAHQPAIAASEMLQSVGRCAVQTDANATSIRRYFEITSLDHRLSVLLSDRPHNNHSVERRRASIGRPLASSLKRRLHLENAHPCADCCQRSLGGQGRHRRQRIRAR